jgi:hypothetical protein
MCVILNKIKKNSSCIWPKPHKMSAAGLGTNLQVTFIKVAIDRIPIKESRYRYSVLNQICKLQMVYTYSNIEIPILI